MYEQVLFNGTRNRLSVNTWSEYKWCASFKWLNRMESLVKPIIFFRSCTTPAWPKLNVCGGGLLPFEYLVVFMMDSSELSKQLSIGLSQQFTGIHQAGKCGRVSTYHGTKSTFCRTHFWLQFRMKERTYGISQHSRPDRDVLDGGLCAWWPLKR